jgi:hypothetical protein
LSGWNGAAVVTIATRHARAAWRAPVRHLGVVRPFVRRAVAERLVVLAHALQVGNRRVVLGREAEVGETSLLIVSSSHGPVDAAADRRSRHATARVSGPATIWAKRAMHSHPNDRPHATNTLRPEVSMNDRRHALAVAFAVALAAGRGPAGAATARQKTYRIGVLDPNAEVHADTWNEFVAELKRRGYQEGRNLVFDRRASEAGRVDLLNRNAVALAALPST